MAKYKIETDKGNYLIETEDAPSGKDLMPTTPVPKWGQEHPNLYGVAEAVKSTFKPLVPTSNPVIDMASTIMQPNITAPGGMKVQNPIMAGMPIPLGPGAGKKEMADTLSSATAPANLAMLGIPMMRDVGEIAKTVPEALQEAKNVLIPTIKATSENIGNLRKPVEFAQEVRSSMFGLRKQLGKELDSKISELSRLNPEKPVDLSEHFAGMKDAMTAKDAEGNLVNPGLRNEIQGIIRKVKDPIKARQLQALIDNPEGASQLTLKQSEEIKRAISQSPTIQKVYQQGRFANITNGDREILDLLDNIKNTQAEQFSQLSEIRKPYAENMSAYNKVKGKFKEGTLLGKMRKGFGDEETMANVQKILPETTFKKIQGFSRTGKVANALGWGLGVGAGEETLRRLIIPMIGKAFKGD